MNWVILSFYDSEEIVSITKKIFVYEYSQKFDSGSVDMLLFW